MNAPDIIRYGHLTLLGELDSVSVDVRIQPGACGSWSIADIVAHLASYELVLIEILDEAAGNGSGPSLTRFRDQGSRFNDLEVANRRDRHYDVVLDELRMAHATAHARTSELGPEFLSTPGTVPWYGSAYSLEDLIVFMSYGHKREHAAQIAAFRDAATLPG